jgi:hypothetical protein
MRSKTRVKDRIPPEVKRRAERAGFKKDPDWYAGRVYEPEPESTLESTPPDVRERLARATSQRRTKARQRGADVARMAWEPIRRIIARLRALGRAGQYRHRSP